MSKLETCPLRKSTECKKCVKISIRNGTFGWAGRTDHGQHVNPTQSHTRLEKLDNRKNQWLLLDSAGTEGTKATIDNPLHENNKFYTVVHKFYAHEYTLVLPT